MNLRAMPMKMYFTFTEVPGLELHHQNILCHIQDTMLGACLQRCSWCVLQPQSTGLTCPIGAWAHRYPPWRTWHEINCSTVIWFGILWDDTFQPTWEDQVPLPYQSLHNLLFLIKASTCKILSSVVDDSACVIYFLPRPRTFSASPHIFEKIAMTSTYLSFSCCYF